MSNLKFSRGKFSKFLASKGFYVAIALCLTGAGTATWLAVDRTISGIEIKNNQLIESENQWKDYPKSEVIEKKQTGITRPAESEPSTQPSSSSKSGSSSSSSQKSGSVGVTSGTSNEQGASQKSQKLVYDYPIKGEILKGYSAGELIKNVTLNDWRTHDGVDFSGEKNADIYAIADGVVVSVVNDPLWGTTIAVEHIDGNQSIYSGLASSVPIKKGDTVSAKQSIGKLAGVPCELSDGIHLHFAMKNGGKWIDPLRVFQNSALNG